MYDNLRALRLSKGLTQAQFGKSVGIAKTTYNNYETGEREPKSDFWISVAQKYNVSIDYLMGFTDDSTPAHKNAPSISEEAHKVAKQYDKLDRVGKGAVKSLVEYFDKKQIEPESIKPKTKIIPMFGNSFAAGPAEPIFREDTENYEVPEDSKAEFAIKIHGDSMEPYLKDGSVALGTRERAIDGDVVAVSIDGEFLCKQACSDSFGNLYLFSLNRSRKDSDRTVLHNSDHTVYYFGKIIMAKRVPLPKD